MITSCRSWHWRLCWAWLAIGGAITSSGNSTLAQITPDTTLGSENSTVASTDSVDQIHGGATRGANLFHSFQEFNVEEGRAAVFTNPTGIENILSRVTGSNPSNILGTLGVRGGNANLFLINPNGIIFGPNARLDVGGSFVGTTANAIGFGDQGFFSASSPESSSSLLTVNPSALLFNQIKTASIQNNSVAPSGLNPSSEFTVTGLRVPDGKSLLLVGGDINMDDGELFAFGGRIELGGLAGAGIIELNGDGNNLSLSFPDGVERSDVSLSNGAGVAVTADDGGSIAVNAQNVEITGESFLAAGIESRLGSDHSKAGNIEVNATGAINLNNVSFIANQVLVEASGQGGDVNISASTLQVEGGAQVSAGTSGAGKGGSLTIDAQDVQVIGESADGQFRSGLLAQVNSRSTGDAGNLTINTGELLIRDGARVSTDTRGSGKGGNLTINTGELLIRDGAEVSADTFGSGKGGNLSVTAKRMEVIGESADSQSPSLLSAQVNSRSTGDAGNLTINTGELRILSGSQVSASTFGGGKAGNLSVTAQKMEVIGRSTDGESGSGLFAQANSRATGDAGNLTINTGELLIRDGAFVSAGTLGSGKGGNLTVTADIVQLVGESADGRFDSLLSVQANPRATGDAGNLMINTGELLIRDGARVSASTFGGGKGGNLTVTANKVEIIGRSADGQFPTLLSVRSNSSATGDAGNLMINTGELLIRDGAQVSAATFGAGKGGNLTIDARSIRLNNDALLSANTQSAEVDPNREQATININSQDLIMSRNSNIFTNATGANVIGGNINIDTDFLIAFENSDISANSANFRGGNVRINAQGVFGTQFRDVASDRTSDITATGTSPEFSGTVELNTPDTEPNSGLVNLPSVTVDSEVVQACTPGGSQAKSEFVVTGRGGLPPNPGDALSTDAVMVDLVALNPSVAQPSTPAVSPRSTNSTPTPIVEAQGWVVDAKGNVTLIANAPTVTPHRDWLRTANCRAF